MVEANGARVGVAGTKGFHRGSERGETGGGVPVRNVAWPVTGRPYTVFHFEQSAGHVSAPRTDHHDRTEARPARAVDT